MSATEVTPAVSNRAGRPRRFKFGRSVPLMLSAPTVIILAGVFGYPLYRMIMLSFQNLTTRDLYTDTAPAWVGFAQYTAILHDRDFWDALVRTVVFTAATVAVSILLGLLVAMMLNRVSPWVKILVTTVLMFVWSVPQIVSIQLFSWMTDTNFSVVSWLLSQIPGVHMQGHDWFLNPHEGLAVASFVVIWGALPFLAITLHAGMTMVPRELLEAARMDGASGWRVFRAVTLPILKPLLVIVTTLSIVWDIQVFNQIWLLRQGQPDQSYWTLSIFAYNKAIANTQYSPASAIGLITVLLMLGVMVFYIRTIFRIGDND